MPILFNLAGPHVSISSGQQRGVPPPMRGWLPLPAKDFLITGVTKDSAGAALGTCQVQLFRTADDVMLQEITSDASGNYEFRGASLPTAYYIVAYKAGSPDVFGTTLNTLVAA